MDNIYADQCDNYAYRYIRSENSAFDNGRGHSSEITSELTFYTSRDATCERDFTWNSPVVDMINKGETPELMFVILGKTEMLTFLKGFPSDRVLVRFKPSLVFQGMGVGLYRDEQIGELCGSHYFLNRHEGENTIIPDHFVEVFIDGNWKPKNYFVSDAVAWRSKLNFDQFYDSLSSALLG